MKVSAFGRNVRALRESKGMTQNELADRVGVTSTSLGNWETRGVVRPKTTEITKSLCRVLECTEQDLFGISDGFYAKYHGSELEQQNAMPSTAMVESLEGGKMYAPPELCSDGNYFMPMPDESMGKAIPMGCNVLIDIYETPKSEDIALVAIGSDAPAIRHIKQFEDIYIVSPDSWDSRWKRQIIDCSDPDAPEVRILGVARYICKEL